MTKEMIVVLSSVVYHGMKDIVEVAEYFARNRFQKVASPMLYNVPAT
jgi:hypothetical protein